MPGIPLRNGGPAARIAVIPGDGIGKEVTPEAIKVLKAVAGPARRPLEFVEFDWSADRYLRDGVSLPAGAVEMLRDEFDAILFGALGDPRVPSNQHAADILLGLRFKLDLYVNERPVELLHDRLTPVTDAGQQRDTAVDEVIGRTHVHDFRGAGVADHTGTAHDQDTMLVHA